MNTSYRKYQELTRQILEAVDITINGSRPWDIQVHNDNFYKRVIGQGALGFGESYMAGWWDAKQLDETIFRILRTRLYEKIKYKITLVAKLIWLKLINLQSKQRAFIIGEKHYDIGNELFENMLDKRMIYSCAYWQNADNLDNAQENKLELICRKLQLEPGMQILDIGCGWGGFMKYAAEKYKVKATGITVSKKQVELGEKHCKGLPVTFRLMDYRDVTGSFDRVVSIGMIEHVGYKNHQTFFEIVSKCLKDDGLLLLHTIGSNITKKTPNPWIHKYIFPNGILPSLVQLGKAMEKKFVMEDWHNFGVDYDKTLMSWYDNFEKNWEKIKDNYPDQFFRMWKFYLLSSAGAFRARDIQLWQIVLSKNGILNGYSSIR